MRIASPNLSRKDASVKKVKRALGMLLATARTFSLGPSPPKGVLDRF